MDDAKPPQDPAQPPAPEPERSDPVTPAPDERHDREEGTTPQPTVATTAPGRERSIFEVWPHCDDCNLRMQCVVYDSDQFTFVCVSCGKRVMAARRE